MSETVHIADDEGDEVYQNVRVINPYFENPTVAPPTYVEFGSIIASIRVPDEGDTVTYFVMVHRAEMEPRFAFSTHKCQRTSDGRYVYYSGSYDMSYDDALRDLWHRVGKS